jgi:GNAT superfamily N-acetyltransferase
MSQFADVKLTFFEMHERPYDRVALPEGASVRRLKRPSIAEYRTLYDGVGGDWHWADRRVMAEDELRGIIQHPDVHVLVLEAHGKTAGFSEVDLRKKPDAQIAYFGLMPGFVGKGLGRSFLNVVIQYAWDLSPERVWLSTCSLDHPAALPLYRSAGFVQFKTEAGRQRLLGGA